MIIANIRVLGMAAQRSRSPLRASGAATRGIVADSRSVFQFKNEHEAFLEETVNAVVHLMD